MKRKKTNTMIIGGALAAVLALIIGVVLVNKGGGEKGAGGTTTAVATSTSVAGTTTSLGPNEIDPTTLGPGEVFLEPVNSQTVTPFTPSARTANEATPTVPLPTIPLPTTTAPLPTGQVASVNGNVPGLYGGTRNAAECDQAQMINYLEQNPDKGAAWAGVQGIAVSEIRTYISGLTPVVLTRDTRVTNHGFRNGQAYAHPSVLQAGHAVLVDKWGVPRAKCSCGNPLTPPVALSTPPVYVGPRWATFDPTVIIVVVANQPVVDGFVLVDLTTGQLIIRTIGATPGTPDLATGNVRVTLRWSTAADIDLAVTDPTGATVSYGNPSVPSGGQLDVDANSGCSTAMAAPAENIIWQQSAPNGRYTITVTLFDPCSAGDSQAFQVTAFVGGVPVQLSAGGAASDGTGVVSSGAPSMTFVLDVGAVTGGGSVDNVIQQAALNILDQKLTACGADGQWIDGGMVEGGWRWIFRTPGGDASFVVYDPTGSYVIQPEDELAASIAVNCNFYTP